MMAGQIELAFTVSARDLDRVRIKLASRQFSRTLRRYPVANSLLLRIMWSLAVPCFRIAERLGRNDLAGCGPEGVHWGAQDLIAGPEDLTLRRAARTAVYRWAAVRELRKTRTMILLMITSMDAVLVPRRAFASRKDEKRFCDFVRGRITGAAKPRQESLHSGYRYS